jgi:hypothetical protein
MTPSERHRLSSYVHAIRDIVMRYTLDNGIMAVLDYLDRIETGLSIEGELP